ncbi:polyprenol phosphomannose-dependent alpha 1,6 mannosyltransferase MptB [Streptomyces sp. NBC_00102]|uniref:polyprenol phosphomannose-dependent alpha 1,6 mannosyltransferase MptB n=1 Tax=Streptomyces sp. NBC_00102 TaxID=2975652 RepID=UPI0022587579|nr:polyprenol phosphomannose-dependent alpha 1,6 mannosyltransferase MptB [Streptomyces sp. NBC_00102]MCX5396394.1 polyprenol phosphomannose-dependent alpha 1,6 mannosyltransferase MptB [Streptomyces sp. NBC_00102]
MRGLGVVGCRRLGLAGSLAIGAGGWAAGRLPVHDPWGWWTDRGPTVTTAGAALAYAGLTALVVAWWAYGRTGASVRHTLVTLAWWVAPLLLTPPLYSADVYSYVAQGAMVLEGHDVYSQGPSVLDPAGFAGDAAASVGLHWTDTPAPYGPFFLLLARGAVALTGGTLVPAVLALRLVAVGALLLIVWAVRRLAREYGADESGALWLAALNPLLLIHVVGGVHNDGLMAGLALAGAVCALRGRWVLGAVLIGLAMMVKSPAGLALLFVGVVVGRGSAGTPARRIVTGVFGPGLVAATTVLAVSVLSGTGFGWLHTQSVAAGIHTSLSLSSDLGAVLGTLAHTVAGADPEAVKSAVRLLGLAAAAALVARFGWRSATGRLDPLLGLGLALTALVLLSPMVQPWYALWGVPFVAARACRGPAGRGLAVLCAALVYETHPSGSTPGIGFAVMGVVAVTGWLLLRREAAADRATSGGAGVPGPRRAGTVRDGVATGAAPV